MNKKLAKRQCLPTLVLSLLTAPLAAFQVQNQSGSLVWADLKLDKATAHRLIISGPGEFRLESDFPAGQPVSILLNQLPAEGAFVSEVRAYPAQTEVSGEHAPQNERGLDKAAVDGELWVTGFSLVNGTLVPAGEPELFAKDQVFNDDLIVEGRACVGDDCSNGFVFGFSTLVLNENNVRLRFQDTSTSASFPSNDWELTANDSTNGGSNYFAISDITLGRTPFRVEAGAPTNGLYLESDGDVGFGTSNPVLNLHTIDGNTPGLRLEQDGTGGFAAYTWDVAGNETNFFVRDATNASNLPFRILAGAEGDALVIDGSGNIGLNISNAEQDLHISRNGPVVIALENTADNGTDWVTGNNPVSGNFIISDTVDGDLDNDSDGLELQLDAAGNLTISGFLSQNSNRDAKQDFEEVDAELVLKKLRSLSVTQWRFKESEGQHIGPMAQDFYAAFGLGTADSKIATLDVAGVSILAIQELSRQLEEKSAYISSLEQQIDSHKARLEQKVASYESRLSTMETLLAQLIESPHDDQRQEVAQSDLD